MSLKSFLLKLYYLPLLPKAEADANQKKIRDTEWNAIKEFIPKGAKFLDVGCGAGYAMKKATDELGCDCFGIDPDPGGHGVGRYDAGSTSGLRITKGESEKLPFDDSSFDLVYCSHVLEHVKDEIQSLKEMKRVLKPGGTLIIGMPTAAMAFINLVTEILFTTHHRFVNVFMRPFINTAKTPLINLFIPPSHSSDRAQTVGYDLKHYRVDNWKKTVGLVFAVKQTLLPALYPYPQYWQLFSMKLNAKESSSVFFICSK
ncbi:MAG: class I SAM-dependent methyltransferase [Bacteroidota bacterium]